MRKKNQPHGARQDESAELTALRLLCLQQADELAAERKRCETYETIAANTRHGLTFVQDEWKLRFSEAQAEITRLKAGHAVLEQKNEELAGSIKRRFEELAALTKLLCQQQVLEEDFAGQVAKNAELREQQQVLKEDFASQLARNAELEVQNARLEERLERQDAQLQTLAQRSVVAATATLVDPPSNKSVVAFLAPWTGKERRKKDRRDLEQKIALVRASGLFDEAWYLERYPDVREWDQDPVLHYLMHGAAEGRDPSSLFSTREYCSRYSDVAASNINPLLHYIRFGGKEGRLIRGAI